MPRPAIDKLNSDISLAIADNLDPDSLEALAKAWEPMSQVLASGHGTSHLVKLALNDLKMITGPSYGGLPPADYLERLRKFNKGRTFLDYGEVISVPLMMAPLDKANLVLDGFHPPQGSFMGESGGCVYLVNVFVVNPPNVASKVEFYLPPSSLTGRKYCFLERFFNYEVQGLAIDADQNRLAVMESNGGWSTLHIYNLFEGTRYCSSFTNLALYSHLRTPPVIQKMEIRGEKVVVVFQAQHNSGPWGKHGRPWDLLFFDTNDRVVHKLTGGDFNGANLYQFLSQNWVLVITQQGYIRALRLLSNGKFFEHRIPIPQYTTPEGQLPIWVDFVPNVSPIIGEPIGKKVLFYANPYLSLMGIRLHYGTIRGHSRTTLLLQQVKSFLSDRDRDAHRLVIDISDRRDFTLCGQSAYWMEGTELAGYRLHVQDFNPNACKLYRSAPIARDREHWAPRQKANYFDQTNPNPNWYSGGSDLQSSPIPNAQSIHTMLHGSNGPHEGQQEIYGIYVTRDCVILRTWDKGSWDLSPWDTILATIEMLPQ